MPLASGNNLREQYGHRITGEDGYFDSFELAIFDGYRPRNIETPLYQSPLVVFSLPSPRKPVKPVSSASSASRAAPPTH